MTNNTEVSNIDPVGKINNTVDLVNLLIPADTYLATELRFMFHQLLLANGGISILRDYGFEVGTPVKSDYQLTTLDFEKIYDESKKNKQFDEVPVPAYLASLAHAVGKSYEKKAHQWAQLNVHVLLELQRLTKREDNIRRLCKRFRLAQAKLSSDEWLWKALPPLSNNLKSVADNLFKIEKFVEKNSYFYENKKIVNPSPRIAEIHQAYAAAAYQKQKKDYFRESNEKKDSEQEIAVTQSFYADEGQQPIVEIIHPPQNAIKNISRLEQLNDQQSDVMIEYESDPPKGTESSSQMQYYALRMQSSHIKRRIFEFPTSPKILPLVVCQAIFKILCTGLQKKNAVDCYLLFYIISGRHAETWKELVQNINVCEETGLCHFEFTLDISNQENIRLKNKIKNSQKSFTLPLSNQLHKLIIKYPMPTKAKLLKRIAGIKNDLKLPVLTLGHLQRSLHATIRRDLNKPLMADLICDTSPRHSPALFYSSFTHSEINATYEEAILLIAKTTDSSNFEKSYLSDAAQSGDCGSQITPKMHHVKLFFRALHDQIFEQSDPYKKFNAYTLWLWHVCLLLTSIRPVKHAPGMLNYFKLREGLLLVSDKECRTTAVAWRVIPLCEFLCRCINQYQTYLINFNRKHGLLDEGTYQYINDILISTKPLLNIFKSDQRLLPITPSFVSGDMKNIFPYATNWTRHFGRDYLSQTELPIFIIDGIFGHELPDHEALHPHSALSINDIKKAAKFYSKMATDLDLLEVRIEQI